MSSELNETLADSAAKSPLASSSPSTIDHDRELERLIQEHDSLKAQIEKLKVERDEYLRYVYALSHKEFHFDKKELLSVVGNQKPLREFIAELAESERKHGG